MNESILFFYQPPSPHMVDSLFRFAVPLLKSDCSKIREAIISGLGRTSPSSYRLGLFSFIFFLNQIIIFFPVFLEAYNICSPCCRDFIEEIHFLVREALDRRAEVSSLYIYYILIFTECCVH